MSKIGRYRIESEVGRGAMGVVHLAVDARLGRSVALKTLAVPPGLSEAQDREFRERFLREARAAAGLSHPAIVTVFDADEDPETGVPFIAMEYVEGATLADWSRVTPELDVVRNAVDALADGLDVAHGAGIVHRDIKPANILVRQSDGAVKIADFGVARLTSSELTHSGTSLGSPAYMSPEQVRGSDLDGRSDLFSLAVVIYELLCGERPFDGPDTAAVLYGIVHETPIPISKRREEIPASLDRFFDRALAKDPADRFPDGAALRSAFETACDAEPDQVAGTMAIAAHEDDDAMADGIAGESIALDARPGMSGIDAAETTGWRAASIAWVRQSSPKHRTALGLAIVAILVSLVFFSAKDPAYLKLDATNRATGTLSVLVDGTEVYSRELNPPPRQRGLIKKMKRAFDAGGETFEAVLEVPPGVHELEARILTDEGPGPRSSVIVELEPGQTRRVKISTGTSMSLKLGG